MILDHVTVGLTRLSMPSLLASAIVPIVKTFTEKY